MVISRSIIPFHFSFPLHLFILQLQLRLETVMPAIHCQQLDFRVTPNYQNVLYISFGADERSKGWKKQTAMPFHLPKNPSTSFQRGVFIFVFTGLGLYRLRISELRQHFPHLPNSLQLFETAL